MFVFFLIFLPLACFSLIFEAKMYTSRLNSLRELQRAPTRLYQFFCVSSTF